jgi:uncharacterized membrane protein
MSVNKSEFLLELAQKLSQLPWEEVEDRWAYYNEMIDDRMEEGLTEEQAVAELGSVDEIVDQIVSDVPLSKLVLNRAKHKRNMGPLTITLLILGFPVWLPLLISLFAVVLSLWVVLWSVIISLYAVGVALVGSAVGGILAALALFVSGQSLQGTFLFGCGIACAGLSILMILGCNQAARGAVKASKGLLLGLKYLLVGRRKTV